VGVNCLVNAIGRNAWAEVPARSVGKVLWSWPNVHYVEFENFLLALIPSPTNGNGHVFSINLCGKVFAIT
jgi:hypothetical protein